MKNKPSPVNFSHIFDMPGKLLAESIAFLVSENLLMGFFAFDEISQPNLHQFSRNGHLPDASPGLTFPDLNKIGTLVTLLELALFQQGNLCKNHPTENIAR